MGVCGLLCAAVLVGILPHRDAIAAESGHPAFTDPTQTDDDFALQGEYLGTIEANGQSLVIGAQVIALGEGAFDVVAYPGGLPGDGWMPPEKFRGQGTRTESGGETTVKIEGMDWTGAPRNGEIRAGAIVVFDESGSEMVRLPKKQRISPTLGQKPPEGAVVIVDGPGPVHEADTLVNGRLTDDGLLMEGVNSQQTFGDALWHIEFRLPYQPLDRGQGRGNSGVYVQGCYEVQVLDSFGLDGRHDECGSIYSVAAPRVNACLPPLEWQTYDIDFTAPKFVDGQKVANARMTVRHNGILIQDDVEVAAITPAGSQSEERPLGPLYLQDHGNPVRYRNIWVKPR